MTDHRRHILRRRLIFLGIALALVPLGFGLKYYRGPGQWWVNNWGASLAYEWLFMALALAVWPRRSAIVPVATAVAAATILIEFAQLWKPPWLQAIRGTFPGAALLGNSFSWWDLPAYPLSCALGAALLLAVWRR